MNILYEDNSVIVCEKPAGVATQAGKVTERDLVSEVNNYLRKAGAKASAYLIHRLDKPVRGILVFAKDKRSAAELNRQITEDKFEKRYFALVENGFSNTEVQNNHNNDLILLENYMYKDSKENKAVIVKGDLANKKTKEFDVKLAKLEYRVLGSDEIPSVVNSENLVDDLSNKVANGDLSILDIHLLTGRFHQIRCQLSNAGHPIVGDTLYGSSVSCKKRKFIGLIAYSLSFIHPVTKKRMSFSLNDIN